MNRKLGQLRRNIHLYGHTELSEGTTVEILGRTENGNFRCYAERADWEFEVDKDDIEITS